jgi:hypothetical protein
VLHRKNSWKFSVYLLDLYDTGYIQTFISLTLFYLSNRKPSKKFNLCQLFCFDRFLLLCVFAARSLSFWVLLITKLLGKLLQWYIIYMWWFWVETWSKKGLIQCYAYTNVANRVVLSFVWRKFSSVGIGEWWDELKNGQKLKLQDAHAPQEISKRYKRESLGIPPRHPFFIGKNQVTFQHTIFLLLHALCILLGASVILVFSLV